MPNVVRVVAVAIVRRPSDGAILVSEGSDAGGSAFQRPLGGTVEFGERATETVQREFLEELGVRVRSGALLGVLENLFTLAGSMGHEVDLPARESRVHWRAPGSRVPPLVPAGIEELL